jgi:hypothetical protein
VSGWDVLAILIAAPCLVAIVQAIAGRDRRAELAEARFHIANLIDAFDRPPNTVQERAQAAEQFLNGGAK